MKTNKKRMAFISIAIAVLVALCAGFSVSAANRFRGLSEDVLSSTEETEEKKTRTKEDLIVAEVDSIEGDKITLTLGSLTMPEFDSTETPDFSKKGSKEDSESTDSVSSATPTIPNFSSEESDRSTPPDLNGELPEFVDGEMPTPPDLNGELPEFIDGEMPEPPNFGSDIKNKIDLTENFVKGNETLTLTVQDSTLIDGIKAGDIVTIKYTDNTLEQIRLLSDGFEKQEKTDQNRSTQDQKDDNIAAKEDTTSV